MRIVLRALLALLVLLPLPAGAQEKGWDVVDGQAAIRETIRSFVSEVRIERNGNLDVTETIRIRSLGQEIQRGIQRDFPTTYTNHLGQKARVGFELVSVTRDGRDEPAERMGLSNGVRIRIGQADVLLPPGEHTYVIRYRTTRQIIYGEAQDEIYWNATGNGWTFPIDMAEARITLPGAAQFGDRAVYTGPEGSTEKNAAVIEERPGFIAFRTTAPLGREQGLTVAAAFPKGVLDAPSDSTKLGWWLQDWGPLGAAVAALVGLLAFYVRAWAKAGRNPRAGTIVPVFTPPDNLTPAAMRYIAKMKFDNRAFSAAIVDLGVQGKLHIDQAEGGWLSKGTTTLSKKGEAGDLPRPEAGLLKGLFAYGNSIELKQANHTWLQSARGSLKAGLENAYRDRLFCDNRSWALNGLLAIPLAMFAVAVVAIFVSGESETAHYVIVVLAVLLCGGAWRIYDRSRARKNTGSIVTWAGIAVLGGIGGFMVLGILGIALSLGALAVLLPLVMIPVAISAFWWMYAPTQEGRAVMDRIAGFRQYLSITDEERLDRLHPPARTPELFERYLPHAIALDVENRWARSFAGVLAAAAAGGAVAGHTVGWYSGERNFWDDPDGFTSSVGSSLASTVSSAATSPSSSGGGSSGGGSSGGGGGGGGGSGW